MRVLLVLLWVALSCPLRAASATQAPSPPLSRFLPVVFFTPDTGLGGGGFLIRNLNDLEQGDPSQLVAFATVTQKKQVIAVAEPKIYWDQGRWEWTGKLSGQDFPSEYYGSGSVTLHPDDAESYRDKRFSVETRIKNIFYDGLFWDVEYGAGWQRFTENHDDPTPRVDAEFSRWGHKGEQHSMGLGLGHDSRSSRVRATSGHLIRSFYQAQRFKTDRDQGHFGLAGLDWKHYLPLDERQTLALQMHAAQMNRVDVPFYLLQGLGGNQVLRGFYGNQFRDYAISYGQAEWRTLWRQDWGFRIFAGVGAHAGRLRDLKAEDTRTAGGLGLDYFLDRKSMNNLRLDVGFSQDIVGVYVLYGNAF
ncbi:MAG TPA: BamA/TamA family outer membrane protein [Oligoflexus sp.]|uniref:BamA/TamA family outer membrane protein n=1 Tax=Oligoflexus sp. TaxID=1971216 RepID=UPI002D22C6DC|nr:BamA/TamA family outer membrane protein [Oligoflexus sp.]HYX37194.1 BamA/TamA family outer membrane protein [Oligoflexus sp.]